MLGLLLLSPLAAQNVGIGIATPTQCLHVAGNLRLDNAFLPGNDAGAVGNILLSQGPGVAPVWLANGNLGDLLMSMGAGQNPIWAPNPICTSPTLNRFIKFTSTSPTAVCNTTLAEETSAPNRIWNADGGSPVGSDKFSIHAMAAAPWAVNGYSTIDNGGGVYGQATGANGTGVCGTTNQATGIGVFGLNLAGAGTGVVGAGNAATASILTSGSGGAFTGTGTGSASWATNTNGTGVLGAGNAAGAFSLVAGSGGAFRGTRFGVYGYATNTSGDRAGGYFESNGATYAYVAGNVGATNYKIGGTGSVSTIVSSPGNFRDKTMFCSEAAEILFMDFGYGQLREGRAYIELDPIFANNIVVDERHPLRVYIQLRDDCEGVYVTNESIRGFEVRELRGGRSNARFFYQVVANRQDEIDPQTGAILSKHEGIRFPEAPKPLPIQEAKAMEVQSKALPEGKGFDMK